MSGRFPPDLFIIVAVPFIALALGVFLPALVIPAHVHHRFAVVVAIAAFAILIAFATIAVVRRRRDSRPHR